MFALPRHKIKKSAASFLGTDSLSILGALKLIGSFNPYGSLWLNDSLRHLGSLKELGSFCPDGSLRLPDSFATFGSLTRYDSLHFFGALGICDSFTEIFHLYVAFANVAFTR